MIIQEGPIGYQNHLENNLTIRQMSQPAQPRATDHIRKNVNNLILFLD
ncbi:MAG: hypothetical protein NTY80_02250 [candidate division SR1 bacterium]|nr:hypothetical protein [candidate division SR1 bacterium]